MKKDFIRIQAEAYRYAPIHLKPWEAYVQEVLDHYADLGFYPIQQVPSATPYINHWELINDCRAQRPIKAWGGGNFHPAHPLRRHAFGIPAYVISRVVHDIMTHVKRGCSYSFSTYDELRAALLSHRAVDFSPQAQRAQWTDDVAMSCSYAHFGKWPEIQRPVIVEPDWKGLEEYLNE